MSFRFAGPRRALEFSWPAASTATRARARTRIGSALLACFGALACAGAWACACACSTTNESRPVISALEFDHDDPGIECDAGNFHPATSSHYLTCATDDDCVKAARPVCCGETQHAIHRRHAGCFNDGGKNCDQRCDAHTIAPPDAEYMRAACVQNVCTLVTPAP